jgi:GAF domain-containing protein
MEPTPDNSPVMPPGKALDAATFNRLNRQTRLLNAAIEVSRNISSILNPEKLLARTVDIICDAYGFYYAGIFLIETLSDGKEWAVLKAGRGKAGRLMIEHNHKLEVGGRSMVGACTARNQARIALDVGKEAVWFNNPFLPDTRSEMALPLTIGADVIGALTVQSEEEAAFSEEDVVSLQALADQLAVAINNARLHQQNSDLFRQAARRATLLQAGAEVSRNITSILDMDVLLYSTVHIICEEYGFYYAGIFLIETLADDQKWAVLKAGRGEAGRRMVEEGHKLPVGGNSMIGAATSRMEARIALDVEQETEWFNNPFLPDTRSQMALPLVIMDECIGALSVQSVDPEAFSKDDVSTLQMMADQLAVAINNARLLISLEKANKELVRTKTFESIATATGETIHWVGNKAAPIPGCVDRTREDVGRFLLIAGRLLSQTDGPLRDEIFTRLLIENSEYVAATFPELGQAVETLQGRPLKKVQRLLSAESLFEDLEIIESSANTILQIKEDLIGPARHQQLQRTDVVRIVKDTIKGFALSEASVSYSLDGVVPDVYVDPTQLGRVVLNLVKNALEAMDDQPNPHIFVAIRRLNLAYVEINIADNGCGIPGEELTKIWLTFHTSKGKKGGTGLGLPACLQIMERMGGQISVVSDVGLGSTFSLQIPVYNGQDEAD